MRGYVQSLTYSPFGRDIPLCSSLNEYELKSGPKTSVHPHTSIKIRCSESQWFSRFVDRKEDQRSSVQSHVQTHSSYKGTGSRVRGDTETVSTLRTLLCRVTPFGVEGPYRLRPLVVSNFIKIISELLVGFRSLNKDPVTSNSVLRP